VYRYGSITNLKANLYMTKALSGQTLVEREVLIRPSVSGSQSTLADRLSGD